MLSYNRVPFLKRNCFLLPWLLYAAAMRSNFQGRLWVKALFTSISGARKIFFSVFQQVMMDSEAPMAAAVASGRGSVSQRLKILGEGLISSWLGKLDLYSLTMEFWSATTVSASRERFKTAFQEAYRTFRHVLAALIQEGMDSGEFASASRPLEVASGLIGMWDALLLQAWLDNTFDALGASRTCLAVMLRGMGSREEKEPI